MAIHCQSSQSQSGIDLTLRVLQFVKQLRRRIEPGPQQNVDYQYTSILGTRINASLAMKKLGQPKRDRSPTSSRDRNVTYAATRVCKCQQNKRNVELSLLKLQTRKKDHPAIQNIPGDIVLQTLDSADSKLSIYGNSISAIARNSELFMKQRMEIRFDSCSLEEVAQLLIVVHDASMVLQSCRAQFDDAWLITQAQEAGVNFDAVFLANYEHLLMRLHSQLVAALSRKALDLLLLGGYDKKQHRLLTWFTEFSDKPRPLSTSLDIKPSLAVLWGVCWMFYNPHRSEHEVNNSRVSRDAILQNVDLAGWRAPDPTEYVNYGLELIGSQTQPEGPQHENSAGMGAAVGMDLRLRNAETWQPTHLESGVHQGVSRVGSKRSNRQGVPCRSTYYPQFPAALPEDNTSLSSLLPNIPGLATSLTVFPQHLDHSFDSTWQQQQHFPQASLPQRPARHLTNIPSVRVTGTAEGENYAAPQQDFAAFDLFSPSTRSPQAPSLNVNTDFPEFVNLPLNMGNVQPPESSPVHHFPTPRHERTPSLNSNPNMPTPVSIAGCHSPLLSPAERRFSIASSRGHSRQPSSDTSSVGDPDDIGSGRRNHAYKRSEEPPRNPDGKMVCKHTECAGQTFDRKCEWSKHMDKHDRPYKCNVKGCEKLQGFTYSGGLLRHEREVHKMHGGTKKSLYCPFADCKRSSGSGFTRKENLAEHIRRVHRRTSMSADLGHLIIRAEDRKDDNSFASEARRPSELPFPRIAEENEMLPSLKRKLSDSSIPEEQDQTDMRSELKRLRRENEEKDSRLRQLEQAVMALQQRR